MSLNPELESICEDVNKLARPWLFGVVLDLLLFGVLTVQTYVYYLAFPKDRRVLKLAVTWVYLIGAAQTILATFDLSYPFKSGNLPENGCEGLVNVTHFWWTVVASSAVVALAAQWLYAYRIYVLCHKLWVVFLVVCLSLGQLGVSFLGRGCLWNFSAVTTELGVSGNQGGICWGGFIWVWGPLNFLCDTTITVSMSILLLRQRKRTLKKTTHAYITTVIQLVVETGLATSVMVIVCTVTYNLASQDTNMGLAFRSIWTVPGLAMGKVYSNSILALLNSRLTIVGGRNTADPFGISEIRSEFLRTDVGEDQITNAITRRPTRNGESSGPV